MGDLGWAAPELEYVELDLSKLPRAHRFESLTPIVLCSRCGARYIEDPTRDGYGEPIPEVVLDEYDIPREPRCRPCRIQAFNEAFESDTLDTIERRIGLTDENKKTLEALMSIIDNPDRVMMVARVQERMDDLERRLGDTTSSLRDLVESKMENANSRLFLSSLITTAAVFVAGLLFGIVVALVFGG